jgi:hypothetical protein
MLNHTVLTVITGRQKAATSCDGWQEKSIGAWLGSLNGCLLSFNPCNREAGERNNARLSDAGDGDWAGYFDVTVLLQDSETILGRVFVF